MQGVFEALFDVIYLSAVLTLGILMIKNSRGNRQYLLFGMMAVILGAGDSFHLIPRALALNSTGLVSCAASLGIGKLITSITMTIFYMFLYYVWRKRYNIMGKHAYTITVFLLAMIRTILCLAPQNEWTNVNAPLSWGIYRNIPFALLGFLMIVLFFKYAKDKNDKSFRFMWLTIALSFGFYIPVVLWADTIPLIGILMIPKTCAYVWTVWIGYSDMRKTVSQRMSP